jgi:hypothetical protein
MIPDTLQKLFAKMRREIGMHHLKSLIANEFAGGKF